MPKFLTSLTTKLIVSFVALIALTSGMTFVYTFRETKDALKETIREQLIDKTRQAASQITADEVAIIQKLQEGDDGSADFMKVRDRLFAMRDGSVDMKNYYVMTQVDGKTRIMLDDFYGIDEDYARAGEVYESPDQDQLDRAFAGEVTGSSDFYTDEWGTHLSGYAPLRDESGNVVAVLGNDIDATSVIDRQNFIGNTIYYIIGASLLVAALIIGVFALTIIRDIKKLNAVATKISMGDMSAMVDVKRKDEIGELAESFGRMVSSLKIMMMPTDAPATTPVAPVEASAPEAAPTEEVK